MHLHYGSDRAVTSYTSCTFLIIIVQVSGKHNPFLLHQSYPARQSTASISNFHSFLLCVIIYHHIPSNDAKMAALTGAMPTQADFYPSLVAKAQVTTLNIVQTLKHISNLLTPDSLSTKLRMSRLQRLPLRNLGRASRRLLYRRLKAT